MVRRIKELIIKGVNFCELKMNEKKALKTNWEAQISEKVDTGRYESPIEYIMLSVARRMPEET